MARKCKCFLCKKEGSTDTFYKVTDDKGKNKYFCSQDEYENDVKQKQKRKQLLEYVAVEVLEYEEGQIVPPVIVKRIGELNKFYDFDVIMETFKQNKETIQYWIKNKNFTNEYGMSSYLMKIIEGNINDVYNKYKHKLKQEHKQKNNDINLEIINDIQPVVKKNNDVGILAFLDEEDL